MEYPYSKEIILKAKSGMAVLILSLLLMIAGFGAIGAGGIILDDDGSSAVGVILLVAGILYSLVCWIPLWITTRPFSQFNATQPCATLQDCIPTISPKEAKR